MGEQMTSRDRVKAAIHFQKPDRMPHFLPDGKENDILWLWQGGPSDIKDWHDEDGHMLRTDCWGVVWETKGGGSYGEAISWPLADITTHTNYTFPDENNPIYFQTTINQIIENNQSENPKYCLGVMPFNSLNEGTHNVMGLENMFTAYYECPDDLKSFLSRLADKQKESIKILADAGCDGVMGYDDWGLQDRQMVSTKLIEEFFIPLYKANWSYAHELGMDVWMHSCGYTVGLHALFAQTGLNVIQMDQQENMGLETINAAAGGRLAYWCPVDVQKTMVDGTTSDVEAYVKRMIETLGGHKGGLVSMAYSTPQAVGHTPEKIVAMCEAFRKYEKLGLE